ncbi:hypothetical protein M9H77_02243 [Catharanthus roseus]|uniref:Uncharacterized protein n=1 Tax=Catharanthus roseus TaxID=4058 RepID=A0ACC0C7V6_CATRO|nr:hypothetical protein M9H77_02243 [Catharanthus roseus]
MQMHTGGYWTRNSVNMMALGHEYTAHCMILLRGITWPSLALFALIERDEGVIGDDTGNVTEDLGCEQHRVTLEEYLYPCYRLGVLSNKAEGIVYVHGSWFSRKAILKSAMHK